MFDITLCGDWASAVPLPDGMTGTCSQAVQDPSNFDNALFEVNSVKGESFKSTPFYALES